jgi:hypothetical protein
MKKRSLTALSIEIAVCAAVFFLSGDMLAQAPKLDSGKDFKLPLYYPASNGVRALKTVVTGSEWRFITNGLVALTQPKITNYYPDGKLEWIVTSPECTVDVNTKEARGPTNIFFKTADERVFQTGVGFLWQHSTSLLILSNEVFTWIDQQALTNAPKRTTKQ